MFAFSSFTENFSYTTEDWIQYVTIFTQFSKALTKQMKQQYRTQPFTYVQCSWVPPSVPNPLYGHREVGYKYGDTDAEL